MGSRSTLRQVPVAKQATCASIWKSLNQEDGPVIAQFGLDQLKRREEGKINAEQHLGENMAFINSPPKSALNGSDLEWKKSRPYKASAFDFSTARPADSSRSRPTTIGALK